MRRLLFLSVLIALVGVAVFSLSSQRSFRPSQPQAKSVVAGDMAPDFLLEDTNGKPVALSALRGKIVLVNFWATYGSVAEKIIGPLDWASPDTLAYFRTLTKG